MIFYTLIFLVSAFFAFFEVHNKNLFKLVCVFLTFFIGFRHEVGGDWINYLEIKNLIVISVEEFGWRGFLLYTGSPLYSLLNILAPKEVEGIYWINFVCAIIFMLGFYQFFKNKPHPFLALTTALPYLIFVFAMGYTRQATATGLILWGFCFFQKEQVYKYLLFVLLATGFHPTAIIFILLLFTQKQFQSKGIIIVVVVIGGFISLLSVYILSKLQTYSDEYNLSSRGAFFRLIMSAFCGILVFLNRKFFSNLKNEKKLIIILSIGSIILFIASFVLSTFADRIGGYFLVIQPLVLAIFVNWFVYSFNRYLYMICVISFYFIFMMYWFNNSEFAAKWWINYKNYLFL